MSIKIKSIILFTAGFAVLLLLYLSSAYISMNNLTNASKQNLSELEKLAVQKVTDDLNQTANYIAEYITNIETQMDRNMLNAAYALQEMDAAQPLTNEALEKINQKLSMDNLYLTNPQGDFTTATDQQSLNFNLFNIWDGYKMLVDGSAEVLPSDFIIAAGTSDIFKFTAIPRKNGKGIIETALRAREVENAVKQFIDSSRLKLNPTSPISAQPSSFLITLRPVSARMISSTL